MAAQALGQFLECTICLDVPASPIHNCSNGHIICGICAEKLTKCGLCKSTQLEVSVLAERLSRQHDLTSKCLHYDAGCRKLIASTALKGHLPLCYYRNAICSNRTNEICENVSVPLQDFPRHLKEKHGCVESLTEPRYFTPKLLKKFGAYWPVSITTLDGQSFLLIAYINNDAAYFWMTILASEEEAAKYMYELDLEKELDGGKKMKCSWILPVLPYHDYPKFVEALPLPRFINVPVVTLMEFSKKTVVDGNLRYTFSTTHRVFNTNTCGDATEIQSRGLSSHKAFPNSSNEVNKPT